RTARPHRGRVPRPRTPGRRRVRGLLSLVAAGAVVAVPALARLHDGQDHAEGGAHALLALHLDPAVVLGHDAVGDRQAQPGAAADRLAGVARVEDPRQRVGSAAAAVVGDADPGLAVLGAGGDGDRAAVLDRLAGVDQQVDQHLVDLRQVALDQRQFAVVLLHPALVLEVVPDDVEGRFQALVQVRGPHRVAAPDVGELLEVLHDLGDALDA